MGYIEQEPITKTVCIQSEERIVGWRDVEVTVPETPLEVGDIVIGPEFDREAHLPPPGWTPPGYACINCEPLPPVNEVPIPPSGFLFLAVVILTLGALALRNLYAWRSVPQ